jgi:F-type H+-transporting ATPase subunit epsilon
MDLILAFSLQEKGLPLLAGEEQGEVFAGIVGVTSMAKLIKLQLISQRKLVFEGEVEQVTAPGSEGEFTVLPGHVQFFTRLEPGELRLVREGKEEELVIGGGFADVSQKEVKILVDEAVRAEEIDAAKAEEAKRRAEEKMKEKLSRQEFIATEAELRKSLLELKAVERYRKRRGR